MRVHHGRRDLACAVNGRGGWLYIPIPHGNWGTSGDG